LTLRPDQHLTRARRNFAGLLTRHRFENVRQSDQRGEMVVQRQETKESGVDNRRKLIDSCHEATMLLSIVSGRS
jgi:hypothetical protein